MPLTEDQRETLNEGAEELMGFESIDNLQDVNAYLGIEPSGVPHPGHLWTASKLKDLEEYGVDTFVLLADRHAEMNGKVPDDLTREEKNDYTRKIGELYETAISEVCDPEFVWGSDFQESEQYRDDLHRLERNVNSSRAEKAVADVAKEGGISVAQLRYPLMQALDIPYLEADIAVGGMDQRPIHALARDELYRVVDHHEKPSAIHMSMLGSVDNRGGKISASSASSISLEREESIREGIKDAYLPGHEEQLKEDLGPETEYEDLPLLQMNIPLLKGDYSFQIIESPEFNENPDSCVIESVEDIGDALRSGYHPADVKGSMADYWVERFKDTRELFDTYDEDFVGRLESMRGGAST